MKNLSLFSGIGYDGETQQALSTHNKYKKYFQNFQLKSLSLIELERKNKFLKERVQALEKEVQDYRLTLTYYDNFHNFIYRYDSGLLEELLDGYIETVSDEWKKSHNKELKSDEQ